MMTWQIGFLEFLVVEAGVFPGFGVGEAIGGDEWREEGDGDVPVGDDVEGKVSVDPRRSGGRRDQRNITLSSETPNRQNTTQRDADAVHFVSHVTFTVIILRAGHVDKAMALLAQMEAIGLRPNSVSYSYLIDALGSIGRTLEADVLFQEMIFLGFRPRIKLYNVLLRGFLKKGLLGLAVGRHFS
ncbi:hypothetical protein ACLB2K_070699 [Fragaria x ananassa]